MREQCNLLVTEMESLGARRVVVLLTAPTLLPIPLLIVRAAWSLGGRMVGYGCALQTSQEQAYLDIVHSWNTA